MRPRTAKVSLRPATDDHFAWMLGATDAPDGLDLPPGGVDDRFVLELLRAAAAAMEPERHAWLVVDAQEVVGLISFKHRPLPGRPVEIGFGIAPARRGRGYASAAVRALAERTADGGILSALVADTRVDNLASQRALTKAGFRWIGTRVDEEDGDLVVWSSAPLSPIP